MPNTQAPVKPPASRPWQAEPLSDVLLELDSSLEGLSELEAARRLAALGPNELNAKPPRTLAQMAREQLTDPMILILLVAAVLSALLQEWAEAGIIFAIVVVNAVIGIVQERKAQSSLEALRSMSAPEARVVRDGMEMVVPARDLVPGDLVQLGDGSMAPADLRLVEAAGLRMQEAALTGESVPVEKDASAVVLPGAPLGDRSNMAFATAIVTAGRGAGIVVATGMGTEVGHIAGMLEGDEELDTPIKRKLASFGKILTIVGVAAALAVLAVGLAYGRPFAPLLLLAVSLAISVIPESLPATATITMALGVQRMARHEALVRRLPAVETLGGATVICTDKTGTLTQGKPVVTDCRPAPGVTEEELLCLAASLEKPSEHPLADAITAEAQARNIPLAPVEDFLATPGRGIRGVIQGQQLLAGNRAMLEEAGVPLDGFDAVAEGLAQAGKTPLYFAGDGRMLGVVAVADTPKPTSAEAVRAFQAMGIDVVMLTGDNARTAEAVGRQLGVNRVVAEVLPQDKEKTVAELQAQGKRVAMVGDGINDAPALARADVGLAIGAGTDVAIESADVVLMKSDLLDAVTAVQLSRKVIRNIKENLFWAFIYNIIGIPLAAGVWYPLFQLQLSPMFGAAAMSLSSVCVVSNALRLKFFRPERRESPAAPVSEGTPKSVETKGTSAMTKTMSINGMMCAHCQAHVEKALNAIDGVEAKVNLEAKTATLTLSKDVSDDVLRGAVTEAGYEVVSIQ